MAFGYSIRDIGNALDALDDELAMSTTSFSTRRTRVRLRTKPVQK